MFGGRLRLPYEITYSILASIAAIISFSIVKPNIKFAYYFYVITKNKAYVEATEKKQDARKVRNLTLLLYFHLLAPVIISLMFIKPLLE